MYTVLLSGGSGKRLWPLSNDLRSKQYIKVINNENCEEQPTSMIQRVWKQLTKAGLSNNCIITASKGQVEIIKSQLGDEIKIAIEPERRNTFPAVALSCSYLKTVLHADENDTVVILPVDPYTDDSYFAKLKEMESILLNSDADIALIGAKPIEPSSKYGYIMPEVSGNESDYIKVKGFREKPTKEGASELIKKGALWNCGVFCFKIKTILDKVKSYGLSDDYYQLYNNYSELPKISFDYEVLEKADNIIAAEFTGTWKDIGTWNALTEQMYNNTIGNVVLHESCENTSIINELKMPIVAIGTKDVVISASVDGILISDKQQSTRIKDCVDNFTYPPMYEERRWGTITVLDTSVRDGIYTSTRKIKIFENMSSSYHYHNDRDEVWTILIGNAEVIINGIKQLYSAGDVIRFPAGTKHAVKSLNGIEFLEVQIGHTFADVDINRITFNWDEIDAK
ncbi:mannose-1-phosphate guanylyltransferase [Anaerocolumna cellulosilytica]|uniref:Mannose-1-phosphate guanylyltransferase n=1 Tax=Anaerocolumna cellulosilytica TaxID=433286 RepID=A0A6S6QS14_9FIRM|nr:sugar phosphate nucleotidyltransferase [Anaerocolumna cellulosilytica]MBB5194449.1 mannose-1-phosphate guanylyltransferase [Anaerocolumna cellulosilytica]BCJ93394.1 mannose-1-phosphate guanylyltransferase [Anaerocolumna cellulosilytica]